jgi:hypothetical protein
MRLPSLPDYDAMMVARTLATLCFVSFSNCNPHSSISLSPPTPNVLRYETHGVENMVRLYEMQLQRRLGLFGTGYYWQAK